MPPPVQRVHRGDPALFNGLDARHASLLTEIVRSTIEQAAFSELARKHGLFADGAIEAINEWSFQRYEEAMLRQW